MEIDNFSIHLILMIVALILGGIFGAKYKKRKDSE